MYIAFEGIDTAGKSTQIARLKAHFPDAILTKEPGGTPLGATIRTMLLDGKDLHPRTEALLFLADRSEHIEKIIRPNLDKTIFSDRSFVSGIAYAHIHQGLSIDTLLTLNRFATEGLFPDKIILLKLDGTTLRKRLGTKSHDAIERRGIDYMLAVQKTMEELLDLLDIDHLVVDATLPVSSITKIITDYLKESSS